MRECWQRLVQLVLLHPSHPRGRPPPPAAAAADTYQIFNTTSDGALSITWAVQATSITVANWANMYAFAGNVNYTTTCSSPPPSLSPPTPQPPPPPPSPPPSAPPPPL